VAHLRSIYNGVEEFEKEMLQFEAQFNRESYYLLRQKGYRFNYTYALFIYQRIKEMSNRLMYISADVELYVKKNK